MRILAVDDDLDLLLLYRVMLESDGHEVNQATNGSAALTAAREGDFELVLLDMMMPEIDGFGVLAAMSEDPRAGQAPVVIVSARVGVADQLRGLDAGAVAYLTKPFSIDRLRSLVSSIGAMRAEEVQSLRRDAMARLGSSSGWDTDHDTG